MKSLLPPMIRIGLLMLAFTLVAACGKRNTAAPAEDESILAKVDDRTMTMDDLAAIDPRGSLSVEERNAIIESWIERELILKVAEARGIAKDSAVAREIDEARAQVIFTALGSSLRAQARDDTEAREMLAREVEQARRTAKVNAWPWRAK